MILQLIALIPLWSVKINAKMGFPFDCCLQIEEQKMNWPWVYLVGLPCYNGRFKHWNVVQP